MPNYYVTIFLNETRGHRFNAFHPGDALTRGYRRFTGHTTFQAGVTVGAANVMGALGQTYGLFNRDDRPNAETERSLSVGDVLKVAESGDLNSPRVPGGGSWWTVEPTGFRPLEWDEVTPGIMDKVQPQACCPKAEILPCVCMYSFECPDHGTMHIGTHD